MRKRLYIFILLCWLAGIFALMLIPLPPPPEPVRSITYYDKAAHFVFFGVLTYLLMVIGLKLRRFRFLTIALIALSFSTGFAVLAEYLQGFIPGREPSMLDMLAGILGMLSAWPVAYVLHHEPRKKLMLHVCCAPCATAVREALNDGYDIDFFFFNPNIHPKNEYAKRLKEVKRLAKIFGIKVKEGKADHDDWRSAMTGHEDDAEGGERCERCFLYRLKETSIVSKRLGFSLFATTLSVSPHKNTDIVNRSGREAAEGSGIQFLEKDFKQNDGFKKSLEISKEMGLYRQKYCGCEFSMKKRKNI